MSNEKLGADKAPELLRIMDELSLEVGGPGIEGARAGACAWCSKKPVGEFRDDLSRREYGISGCCQQCQDKMFAEDD